MKNLYAGFVFLCLVACQPNSSQENQQQTSDTLATDKQTIPQITTSTEAWDTLYKREEVIIVGDTNFRERFFVYRKYTPMVSFADYQVEQVFKGQAAPVDFASNPLARQFQTVISRVYAQEGVNFAGHYVWVSWSCGITCQQNAIIDVRDGKVYTGPETTLGTQFRKNSRLIIVNPPEPSGYYPDCSYCVPQLYMWDEKTHTFEALNNK